MANFYLLLDELLFAIWLIVQLKMKGRSRFPLERWKVCFCSLKVLLHKAFSRYIHFTRIGYLPVIVSILWHYARRFGRGSMSLNGRTDNFIFYGRIGEFANNQHDQQKLLALVLNLLPISMVYINTLMIRRILRNEDQITSKLLRQASCLPWESRDGYPNLFNSHSLVSLSGRLKMEPLSLIFTKVWTYVFKTVLHYISANIAYLSHVQYFCLNHDKI